MRFLWVGILQFLLLASSVWAGVIGKVESIGFGSYVRPDCWVPLVIQTSSDEDGPREFDLQVVQLDLDGDEVLYTRPRITVNPGTQSFSAYFKPEPVNGGIPSQGAVNASDLAKRVRIFLVNPDTKKRVLQIATAGNLPQALEFGDFARSQGQKLAVVVGRPPNVREYDPRGDPRTRAVLGTMEQTFFVRSDIRHLPENAIGYEMVDALIWSDAEIDKLSPTQFRALRQYVKGGGRLVVIQNAEAARFAALGEFLPVRVESVQDWPNAQPLLSMLLPEGSPRPLDPKDKRVVDPFKNVRGPFRMARAEALPDALVESWVTWPDKTRTPLIARRLYGLGSVSWIAQDITEPTIAAAEFGWPRVWEKLFGWANTQQIFTSTLRTLDDVDRAQNRFSSGGMSDIGFAFVKGTDLPGKTAALISLAFVFFIGYWLIAGPGTYLFLAAKRRTQLSWFVFGATALLATVATMLIAQVVLRGTAQIRHVTLVRVRCDDNSSARVLSRMGIYIPQDTTAALTLTTRDTALPATVTPLVIDPGFNTQSEVTQRDSRYEVPILTDDADTNVSIAVPFRSTLKKVQAEWNGAPPGRLTGKPALSQSADLITGLISNNTGSDLQRVSIVFPYPGKADQVIYLGEWKKGLTLDLQDLWRKTPSDAKFSMSGDPKKAPLNFSYEWLYNELRSGIGSVGGQTKVEDAGNGYPRSFVLASLFDRLAPMQNTPGTNNRVDIARRSVRQWDVSGALAAGAMVVLAQSPEAALPLPLEVDGAPPQGQGHVFWQFIVPMDRSQVKNLEAPEDDKAADTEK